MRNFLLTIFLLLFFISTKAVVFKTIDDGNWEDGEVWSGGNIPGASFHDTVLINHCVFINEHIYVEDQGLIILSDSGKLCGHYNMNLEPGSEFDLYGRIYFDTMFVQGYLYLHTQWPSVVQYVHVFNPGHAYAALSWTLTYFSFVCNCDHDTILPPKPPPPADSSVTSEMRDTVQIDVGPVPFTEWIHIKVHGVIEEVYLTDAIGRLIMKRKFESHELQLGFLSPGIYKINCSFNYR